MCAAVTHEIPSPSSEYRTTTFLGVALNSQQHGRAKGRYLRRAGTGQTPRIPPQAHRSAMTDARYQGCRTNIAVRRYFLAERDPYEIRARKPLHCDQPGRLQRSIRRRDEMGYPRRAGAERRPLSKATTGEPLMATGEPPQHCTTANAPQHCAWPPFPLRVDSAWRRSSPSSTPGSMPRWTAPTLLRRRIAVKKRCFAMQVLAALPDHLSHSARILMSRLRSSLSSCQNMKRLAVTVSRKRSRKSVNGY